MFSEGQNIWNLLEKKQEGLWYLMRSFLLLTPCVEKWGGVLVNRQTEFKTALLKFLLYGGEYWFLYVLFVIFLFVPIIHFMCVKIERAILFEIILAIAPLFIKTNVFCINSVIYYMFYFALGQIFYIHKGAEIKGLSENKFLNVSALILFLLLIVTKKKFGIYFVIWNILAALSGSMVLYWIARHLKPTGIAAKYFGHAGIYSMGFYIVQGYFLVITRTILITVLKLSNPYIIYLLLVIGICTEAMIACAVMSRIRPFAYLVGIPYNKKAKI